MPDEDQESGVETESLEETSEFEDAFSEFATQRDEAPEDADEDLPADEAGKTETVAEGDKTADDESSESAAEQAAADEGEDIDPYEGMSPEAKEKYQAMEADLDKLNHQLRSDAGRVSGMQRKINLLTEEIDGIRAGRTAGPSGNPTDAQIKDAMTGTDEEWDQFSKDYPHIAAAIDKRFERAGEAAQGALDSTLKPVNETLTRVNEKDATDAAKERIDTVAKDFPNWTEAVETPDFKLWLDAQPPGVQGLAFSDDTRDAVELISKYDAHLVAEGKPSLRPEEANEEDPDEPGVESKREPTEIERKRAQQLDAGQSIPSKPAGIDVDAGNMDEFEAAFNHFAQKKARRTA